MKSYKGYYIDGVYFNNESEIDAFVKTQAIEHYKMLVRMFNDIPSFELSVMLSNESLRLHEIYGLDWNEIEALEIDTIKTAA